MQVKVLLVADDGAEKFQHYSELRDCFDDPDDDGYQFARDELQRAGRVYVGGGAAPLFLLLKADAVRADAT